MRHIGVQVCRLASECDVALYICESAKSPMKMLFRISLATGGHGFRINNVMWSLLWSSNEYTWLVNVRNRMKALDS